MTKNAILIEHVIVTFVEAAGAYLIVIPTVNWTKTVLAGAIGAGLSAAYNVTRQSTPTIPASVAPETPLNGVTQLAGMPVPPAEPPAPVA